MKRWHKLLFEDKPDWIGPKVLRFMLDNPAVPLTSLYVLLSGLGLLYQYVLFASFGINVIDYAESEDLFLAAFKKPSAILQGTVIAASLVMYRLIARYARQRKNALVRRMLFFFSFVGVFRPEILIPLGTFYFLQFYVLAAHLEGQRLVERSDEVVNIVTKSGEHSPFLLLAIGSTESFLFGVELNDELRSARQSEVGVLIKPTVRAIPFSEIARLDYNNTKLPVQRIQPVVERDAPQAARPSPYKLSRQEKLRVSCCAKVPAG